MKMIEFINKAKELAGDDYLNLNIGIVVHNESGDRVDILLAPKEIGVDHHSGLYVELYNKVTSVKNKE